MFELMGEDSQKAAAGAKTVIAIETRLAGAQLSRIELRNPTSSYHMMTGAERKTLMRTSTGTLTCRAPVSEALPR
jgi:putative endopeptidase